ncbi:TetR/AcrR family transcriptional regulator [Serratia sp. AKBS12]|uniref:TetR/AcrR family transcriptional regulator n=1 Tax=Serratia sp. AKBS12 TaxID=2974597 RepID=UPI0021653016|nr:TetR/AcrR family transcriptional regulator [Serratia sp. AKBS12]MCS3409879.1 TetR/AcrR family transcriptional regulator [Serratia sp. AKBS12]
MMAKTVSAERLRGRPREYEETEVIERAMQVFWTEGYHATSLPTLLAATQISRSSLYAGFGDKHGIFLRSLDLYIEQALARLDRELDTAPDALTGVQVCIDGYLARTQGDAGRRGCLVVATAMELAAHDKEVSTRIDRFFKQMESRLTIALKRARQAGLIRKDVDPAAFAHMLLCLLEGVRVISKVGSRQNTTAAALKALIAQISC